MTDDHRRLRCLVTGATGYIGAAGARAPRRRIRRAMHEPLAAAAADYPWVSRVERVEADATDPGGGSSGARRCRCGLYLIHALSTGRSFEEVDRQAALTFAMAAAAAKVHRVV